MTEIQYRRYQKSDQNDVFTICHKTGYMGEDCSGIFDDVTLFGYMFCYYYIRFEPENCFVAVDSSKDRVVAYIIGTPDAQGYQASFSKKVIPRIILRMIFVTLWRYNKAFKQVLSWNSRHETKENSLPNEKFKAHLHINVLPGYQRLGIGKKLISLFENRLKEKGISGVYLETSNYNSKALPFYEKNGFSLHHQSQEDFWSGVTDHKKMTFVKTLNSKTP